MLKSALMLSHKMEDFETSKIRMVQIKASTKATTQ